MATTIPDAPRRGTLKRIKSYRGERVDESHKKTNAGLAVSIRKMPDKDARIRARRILIYADMHATLGAIRYRELDRWPYQPTEAEVSALVAEMSGATTLHPSRAKAKAAEVIDARPSDTFDEQDDHAHADD